MFKAEIGTISAGLGGSVGCAVRLETRRSRVQPPAEVGNILLIMKYFLRSFSQVLLLVGQVTLACAGSNKKYLYNLFDVTSTPVTMNNGYSLICHGFIITPSRYKLSTPSRYKLVKTFPNTFDF